ncbi:L,D-transpeptidase family protein [Bradyrhizobium erythrophlei]|jgi:murein L,D-transpeptidase YcbB/YkuD|uniref:Putative peptidoglycan binding domain-containing protein n=1 Tax=Bradyrhizobium erythrophlei TaxID=1437360 RepID=A0A1M7URV9_9BRAD|nr:L,D-transpeptidase family protein [Bradyrhizobium erythrophlei]SHN85627.1 Putative peptidoglycan binding domain-containing protein [Bradyrhizobium erythrophlei]
MSAITRRSFLTTAASGLAAGALARVACAAEGQTSDQMLDQLMRENQENGLGSGFDNSSRNVRLPKKSLPTLSPSTAETTQTSIAQYEAIVAKGGWPNVPASATGLRVGARGPAVPSLRTRLSIAGDLELNSGEAQVFDSYVDAAVRRFQVRHGLHADGLVNEAALHALNVPAEQRLAQLRTNAGRLKALTGNLGNRIVVANIPAAQIEAIENGVAVTRHIAVAGKPDRPSPDVRSKITQINFNPFWTVPVSIIRKDLIPKMQAEPDYLTKNHIRIYDPKNNELQPSQIDWYSTEAVNYKFKQDAGDFNSLGSMKINFPSPDGVYMHDTPSKNLFGEDFRFASSGCMRVQNVRELVYWILAETPGWSKAEIDEVIKSGERKDAKVAKPLPLYWVYVTAWATPDGVVQFRDDIYGRDGVS